MKSKVISVQDLISHYWEGIKEKKNHVRKEYLPGSCTWLQSTTMALELTGLA
jgi:hypothetical protein